MDIGVKNSRDSPTRRKIFVKKWLNYLETNDRF